VRFIGFNQIDKLHSKKEPYNRNVFPTDARYVKKERNLITIKANGEGKYGSPHSLLVNFTLRLLYDCDKNRCTH
jgi:hypothetical protein